MPGEYQKYNNNFGWVSYVGRGATNSIPPKNNNTTTQPPPACSLLRDCLITWLLPMPTAGWASTQQAALHRHNQTESLCFFIIFLNYHVLICNDIS